jgi:hypothetical protein
VVVGFEAHIYADWRGKIRHLSSAPRLEKHIFGSRRYELHIKDYNESNELSRTVSSDVRSRTLLESQGQRENVGTKEPRVELLSSAVSWFDLESPKTYCQK